MDCQRTEIKTYKWVVKKRDRGSHKNKNGIISPAGSGKETIFKK
jgi:hypothetical protein